MIHSTGSRARGQNTNRAFLDQELASLEITASNFSARFIPDGRVRMQYMRAARQFSEDLSAQVERGSLTPEAAARQANEARNVVLNAMRGKSSDIGSAAARLIKREGPTLSEVEAKYAKERYGRPFDQLSPPQRNEVWRHIVQRAGQENPKVSSAARWLGRAGRGLVGLTVVIAVYHVAAAEDKPKASTREAVAIGGGLAGAYALGAAGLICGPAAIACVPLGIFVGGVLGSMGADLAFSRIW